MNINHFTKRIYNQILIERKSASDFIQSLVSNRLWDQCGQLRKVIFVLSSSLKAIYLILLKIYIQMLYMGINQVYPDKKLGVIIILLNNSKVLRINIADFKSLTKATQNQLTDWVLIGGGIGVHWNKLNEDLSLKGIIKDSALHNALLQLQ